MQTVNYCQAHFPITSCVFVGVNLVC